jgi:hypothetical protein
MFCAHPHTRTQLVVENFLDGKIFTGMRQKKLLIPTTFPIKTTNKFLLVVTTKCTANIVYGVFSVPLIIEILTERKKT